MELVEQVVPPALSQPNGRFLTLRGGHDSTNPLLAACVPLASRLLPR